MFVACRHAHTYCPEEEVYSFMQDGRNPSGILFLGPSECEPKKMIERLALPQRMKFGCMIRFFWSQWRVPFNRKIHQAE